MGKENSKNIIDLIKSGNQLALKKIYDDNRVAFINFSRVYNVKTNDALDIYQDAIIIL